ncbi:MAG TPA: DUF1365 domain-containing protein [Kofleriaceae bacterium]
MTHSLYRGTLAHARTDELARRTFRYPVYMASLDLAQLDAAPHLFSHNRWNAFALYDRDYEDGAGGLAASLARLLAANGAPLPATTRLVTNLRTFGYVFNPVSFFLGYDASGALETVVAEINNTYGGRRRYLLRDPQLDAQGRASFRHVRELFVSPFLHGPATYEFWFDAPLDAPHFAVTMHVDSPTARVFTAHFAGERRPLTDRALLGAALRYPVMSAQVIALIHYEAWKLRLQGVPYRRPGPDHRPLERDPPARVTRTRS